MRRGEGSGWSMYEAQQFMLHFFNDPAVKTTLQIMSPDEIVTKGNHIRQQLGTTMYFPGNASITVSDELRRCLLLEGSDGYGGQSITQPDYYEDDEERDERCARVFSAEDRKEFIFNVFKAIVLGGGVCQFDETVGDYLAVTKMIYKDLVSVTRDRVSNAMAVANYVYRVEGLIDTNNRDIELFPVCHPQNFFFLSIDPVKRVVSVWYHGCPSFFQ
ncbi:hypothetical protein BJ742DRAFT_736277 [Cladochytrium replicatum]|nr:hypothetical protein BJ742DRAFT_736277 [Cladochytrium replicatum]